MIYPVPNKRVYTDFVNTFYFSVINKEIGVVKDIYYLNVSLFKKKIHLEVVCFDFKLSEAMSYLQHGGGGGGGGDGGGGRRTPVRSTDTDQ